MAKVHDTGFRRDLRAVIRHQIEERVVRATAHLETAMRAKVATPGPPRSRPGEAPHTDTTDLLRSIRGTTRTQGAILTGTVEIGASYAMELEYGTARMAARPFARSTLAEQELAIVSILAAPLRGWGGFSGRRDGTGM